MGDNRLVSDLQVGSSPTTNSRILSEIQSFGTKQQRQTDLPPLPIGENTTNERLLEQAPTARERAERAMQAALDTMPEVIDPCKKLLAPLSTRIAWLGLQSQLQVDNHSVLKTLERANGPVPEQLRRQFRRMEREGWLLIPTKVIDGGSTRGMYSIQARTIQYATERGSMFEHLIGAKFQAPPKAYTSPIEAATITVGHEIAHHNWLSYPNLKVSRGYYHLADETNAILGQIAVAKGLGIQASQQEFINAIESGQLGEKILGRWSYPELKEISKEEANAFVKTHLNEVHGPNLVSEGKMRNFDLHALIGAKLSNKRFSLADPYAHNATKMESLRSIEGLVAPSTIKSLVGHVGKGAAALSTCAVYNDIMLGFKKGPVEGTHNLLDAGARWGGYEAGAAGANRLLYETRFGWNKLGLAAATKLGGDEIFHAAGMKTAVFFAATMLVAEAGSQVFNQIWKDAKLPIPAFQ